MFCIKRTPPTESKINWNAQVAVPAPLELTADPAPAICGALGGVGELGMVSIWRIKKDFSSLNCSSSVRSARKSGRNFRSLLRFLMRICWTASDLFGLATKTYLPVLEETNRLINHRGIPNAFAYLEDVKAFISNHFTLISQEIHADL
jgi:hypothetical protein